jgi:hypothetical protein
LKPLSPKALEMVKKIQPERIRKLINQAMQQSQAFSKSLQEQAFTTMNQVIAQEIERLKALQAKNNLVSENEIEWWNERKNQLVRAFNGAQVRLDSFLLLIPDHLK